MGDKMRSKGYDKPFRFQFLIPAFWLGGEFLGALVYLLFRTIKGHPNTGLDFYTYLAALAGASLATCVVFICTSFVPQKKANAAEDNPPVGLGGWLVLLGLGILISPIRIGAQMLRTYSDIFSDGLWAVLTTPGSGVYNPFWKPIVFGEMAINSGLLLGWIFIAFLFFFKKRAFKKWIIGIWAFTLTFIFLDAIAIKCLLLNEPVFDAQTIKMLVQALIIALVWVPYMVLSKRVQATFVK